MFLAEAEKTTLYSNTIQILNKHKQHITKKKTSPNLTSKVQKKKQKKTASSIPPGLIIPFSYKS